MMPEYFQELLAPILNNMNIFHWLTILVTLLSGISLAYDELAKALLQRIYVRKQFIKPVIETIWQLSVVLSTSVMIYFYCLRCIGTGCLTKLSDELTKLEADVDRSNPYKRVFIMYVACAIYEILKIWHSRRLKNIDFLEKQFFLAIFVLSDYSKKTGFGVTLLFIVNISKACELGSKVIFFYGDYMGSNMLKNVSRLLCIYSILYWMHTFFYIFPMLLVYKGALNASVETKILFIILWIYICVAIVNSMFTRMVLSYLLISPKRPQTLKFVLFGCEPWILWLTGSKYPDVFGCRIRTPFPTGSSTDQNLGTINQIVRCSILIKRKARRIRERKLQESLAASRSQHGSSFKED